jgi:2-iminobutanoate/2-iminopropanoate deaminase
VYAIKTSNAPSALAAYSQGIDAGGFVFVAGQVGLDPSTGELAEGFEAQVERALRNIAAVLDAAGLTMSDVVKTTCLLANIDDFPAFNDIYAGFIGDPPPARATYAVAALPRGALIEIEAIAVRR